LKGKKGRYFRQRKGGKRKPHKSRNKVAVTIQKGWLSPKIFFDRDRRGEGKKGAGVGVVYGGDARDVQEEGGGPFSFKFDPVAKRGSLEGGESLP